MNKIYYIGGSPCSGKSTVAELLCQAYDLAYFKLDDGLWDYVKRAAEDGNPLSAAQLQMELDEMWMRPPTVQCEEELALYGEMLPYVLCDLRAMDSGKPIVAEGAGFLPALMRAQKVDAAHYVCMVPTEAFQRENYAKRPWISRFLEGCREPDTAFDNWMGRDALFAKAVLGQARALGYTRITVDGSRSAAQICAEVADVFRLPPA